MVRAYIRSGVAPIRPGSTCIENATQYISTSALSRVEEFIAENGSTTDQLPHFDAFDESVSERLAAEKLIAPEGLEMPPSDGYSIFNMNHSLRSATENPGTMKSSFCSDRLLQNAAIPRLYLPLQQRNHPQI
jgi:hypothetical protein